MTLEELKEARREHFLSRHLSERDREIKRLREEEGKKFIEIAPVFGITGNQISVIYKKIPFKFRAADRWVSGMIELSQGERAELRERLFKFGAETVAASPLRCAATFSQWKKPIFFNQLQDAVEPVCSPFEFEQKRTEDGLHVYFYYERYRR